jgi:hypothetical protein
MMAKIRWGIIRAANTAFGDLGPASSEEFYKT